MSRYRVPSLRLFIFFILAAGLLAACSGGGSSQPYVSPGTSGASVAQGSGGVAFRLVWQQPATKVKAMRTPSFNACIDHSITTIDATVSSGTTTVASGSFSCALHEGVVLGVPAGTFTVQVSGISSGATPTTTWTGQSLPVTVVTGQVADAGTIIMSYIGTDLTQPTVVSIGPHSNTTSTTDVPVTDRFDIAFDKPMAISTITSTNITLMDTGTASPVPGIVNYFSASNTASFMPSAILSPTTTYALQVAACVGASCITDSNGNQLASDYTNTFTTEAPAAGIPAAPAGVTATAGNGQVTLDWLASAGTTSYNVYYSTVSGVTPSTGTQVLNVQAPAVHLGLINGTTYYYVVTAVNGALESLPSAEVSATPLFPGGDPLPPASLTVTPSTGQNSISWPAVTGALTYNLYWSTRPIFPDKYSADNVVRGVTSPFTHTGITLGLDYCYIVTALNANGESADSMQACGGIGVIRFFW